MATRHRYGDKGTEVTASEKVVAALFIVGLVALLAPHHGAASDEHPASIVRPNVATPPAVAIDAGSPDAHDLARGPHGGPAGHASIRAVAVPAVASGNR
jgi:hypothetical protein